MKDHKVLGTVSSSLIDYFTCVSWMVLRTESRNGDIYNQRTSIRDSFPMKRIKKLLQVFMVQSCPWFTRDHLFSVGFSCCVRPFDFLGKMRETNY